MNKTRMGKRAASLLLSLVMMLSLLPTAAYAAMADGVDTQGAIVSENGTDVSDDSNSSGNTDDLQVGGSEGNGDTGAQQVGDSSGSGTAGDTTGAEGGADPTDSANENDSADPQDDGDAVMPVASSVVSTSEELVAAIAAANDGDTITLGEGEFTTYGNTSPKKSLTFVGAGTGTVWTIGNLSKDVKGEGNGDCSFDGCETITFQNMTLKSDGADYRGFIRISNTAVKKCTLVGKTAYWGYETAKFEDSTFNAPVGDYALWDYSTKAMTFEGCTFNISGKGVNVYVEQPSTDARTVEVNGCTVNSDKAGKAFLNIKNSTQAFDVTLSGTNTVTGLEANGTTGSALYQVETTEVTETTGKPVAVKAKADDGTVTTLYEVKETVEASVAEVNGAKYKSLQAAVDAAKSGATVTLLADTRENVTVSKNAIVLDLNGHTLNGGTENAKPALTVDNKKVTLKDSSEAQTGTIKREDTADTKTSHYVIDIQGKNGFMIVESGKVENNSGIPGVKGSSLIRLGNDSVSGWPTLTIKGGTFTQDNFIAIKVDRGTLHLLGGTVNSANSFAIENWNNAYIKGGTVNGTVSTWVYSTGAAFSKLEISGGTVNGNVASVNYDNAADKQARVYVTGGTVTGTLGTYTYNNGLVAMDETAKATIEVTGGTFSKDPTQYVVEDSAISKNDDGTYGVAKTYLAKIGDTEYYTMDEAFHAVKAGETIAMLRDYTTNKVQNSGDESFTIDLGGHTWTANIVDTASAAFEINYSDVTLTVKNGKVVSSQLAGLIPSAMSGTITYNNSKLVFDGVEMTANGHSGIETNGSNTNDTVTLKNSTLNVPNGYGIYFPSSGTLTIDNSVINAKTMGVQVCSGSLNISGAGTAITVTGDGIAKTENDGAIEDGAAISIVNRTGYKGLSNIEVKDGKFKANGTNAAVKAYKWENQTASAFDNSKNVVAISGGTFSSAVDKSLCAEGYIPTQNADGTYGVKEGKYVAEIGSQGYESLQEAVAAAEDGQTVRLLADVEQNTQLIINKSITLDLNGKTIKISGYTAEKAQVSVKGNLTIQDSSEAQTGKICSDYTGTAGRVVSVENGGKLTIAGGTITTEGMSGLSGSAVYIASGAEVNMTGGAVKVDAKRGNVAMNVKGSTGVFTMSGGSVIAEAGDGTETYITAISGSSGSTIQISAGTVSGPQALFARSSATTITGGSFTGSITVKNGSISGGTFDRALDKKACAAGYVPTQNGDGTYGVEIGMFTVMVTSRTTGSNSPVANVTGGGSDITYAQGTTVTASAISGYKFVGWFVNEYTGTPYSTDLTCVVKPTDDCTMIAVYEPISGGKFWLTVTASEFTVNGGAVQDSYLYEQFAVGASVTVNFTGSENFLYWVNASNKVVSTDKSYTFIMGSETTLKAVYGKARQNQATVVFISHSDQIISSKAYTTSDTIQFPVPPIKMGCTFTGWSMTESEIREAMANNNGIIQVRARYTEPSIACTVTVVYPEGTDNQVVNAVVGKAIDVTAKDIEGKTFSYWTDNAGNILGYTKTLKLAPSGDMTVKAVYDQAAEAKPVITMSEVSATTANESYVVTFMATRAVPNGYKVVKQGILWSRDAVCGEDGAAAYMQFDSNGKLPDGVRAYIGNNLDLNGVTRYDIITKYNDRTFYGRGYMVLESDAGKLLYIYTDTIASGSYDSLTK